MKDFVLGDTVYKYGDKVVAFYREGDKLVFSRDAMILAKISPGTRYEYFIDVPDHEPRMMTALVYGGEAQERPEDFCAYMDRLSAEVMALPRE